MPKLTIPDKLLPIYQKKKRFKILFGGRGAGKSQTVGDIFLQKAQIERAKIGCFREYQNSIDDSVLSLLQTEIIRLQLSGFNVLKTEIKHIDGGEFKFKGLARNPTSVKSMHGQKYFWVEEAQATSDESLELLSPTIRTSESEVWMTLNPQSSSDPVSKRFLEPYMDTLLKDGYYEDDLHLIIWINYYDNPWFPTELEQERAADYERLPRNLYNHIWLGHYNDSVDDAIIPTEWFEDAVNAHERLGFKSRGIKVLSHDPADMGGDAKAIALRHGSVVLDVATTKVGDVNEAMDWAIDRALNEQVDVFTWDCDGMGLSLKRQVSQALLGKHVHWEIYRGSDGPDRPHELYLDRSGFITKTRQRPNREVFKNKRAQYFWYLRDRFYNTHRAIKGDYVDPDKMISISPKIDNLAALRAEVCRIPRKHNGNGLIQILSKPEMKRMKIKSPNRADALAMCLISPTTTTQSINLEFDSLW